MTEQNAPPERLRVLLVEDELFIAIDLETLVTDLGHEVVGPALSVKHALSILARDTPPDLAVLDVNLGRERVTPVAEWLRRNDVPFVLLSGYSRDLLEDEILRQAPLLAKPLRADQLRETFDRLLAPKRRQ